MQALLVLLSFWPIFPPRPAPLAPSGPVLTADAISAASGPPSDIHKRIVVCKEMLALAKPVSDRITGEDAVLCVASTDGLALVRVRGGISRTPGFTVELVRRNGANSDYHVVRPEGGMVLGIKTNVTGSRLKIGTKRVHTRDARGRRVSKRVPVYRDRAKTVCYVPFSSAVCVPDIFKSGFDYVVATVDKARDALDAAGVTSRVDPTLALEDRKRVTEVVSEKIIVTLLVIEHIDPSWVRRDGTREDDPNWIDPAKLEHAIQQVLSTGGLNRENAYDFAVSSAKASGIAQFIKDTYDRIRNEYDEAGLRPDFVQGMRDHLNAMMAQFCLADWSLKVLRETAPDQFTTLTDGSHEEDLGAWLAAAYNAGEHRAAPLLRDFPNDWHTMTRWKSSFHIRTTPLYIAEFRAVYRYLFVHE